jgi:hypothetical protein
MLKHAGMLEPQLIPMLDLNSNTIESQRKQWKQWTDQESRNRYVRAVFQIVRACERASVLLTKF